MIIINQNPQTQGIEISKLPFKEKEQKYQKHFLKTDVWMNPAVESPKFICQFQLTIKTQKRKPRKKPKTFSKNKSMANPESKAQEKGKK